MHALDHFGDRVGPTTLYELFIGLLLVPLLLLAMCAAARLFLMSAAMRAHLLEPLERMPMRQAFTRLQDFHWVTMLRESGQLERWRDMSRSTEGIRQILNDPDLPEACRTGRLTEQKETLEAEIAELQQHVRALRENGPQPDAPKRACEYMQEIEQKYAACAESILCCILLPYWLEKRHNLMQSKGDCAENEPNVVLLAEEFLAIRYVAFIRAVLAQMRYLLLFITVALVLVMLAINSYPFQPKQEIAWVVTGLFLAFSAGIIMVLAQMHRNPLLSRITDKEAHELGATFYLRVAGFGAVPLITWLATQYPSIGGLLYSIVKPGLDVMK
jgi:DNA-binding transcriptional MerR regulator